MEKPENAGGESTEETSSVTAEDDKEQSVGPRRKLESIPRSEASAIEVVKSWVAQREGRDSADPIESAVRKNLAARNVSVPETILSKGWHAEPRKAGGWVVGFKFISGGQPRTAEWIVDDVRREVKAANAEAAALEWTESKPGGHDN